MNDDQLRALVRDAVSRHLGRAAGPGAVEPFAPAAAMAADLFGAQTSAIAAVVAARHPSHAVYLAVVNDSDACVIEPAVPCNHCNYCRSHGH